PSLYPLRHSRAGGNPGMFKAQQNVANLFASCVSAIAGLFDRSVFQLSFSIRQYKRKKNASPSLTYTVEIILQSGMIPAQISSI
ncbi:MAG: hypothetical protein KDK05_21695, partial [Candidatus Competibacteraceae bacterium]|nr:hypothetical protein [Candidatus Competibacteraceae bacterium]